MSSDDPAFKVGKIEVLTNRLFIVIFILNAKKLKFRPMRLWLIMFRIPMSNAHESKMYGRNKQ